MQKIAVKLVNLTIYPKTDASKKYINKDACFELNVADHAYHRMVQRMDGDIYDKYANLNEG